MNSLPFSRVGAARLPLSLSTGRAPRRSEVDHIGGLLVGVQIRMVRKIGAGIARIVAGRDDVAVSRIHRGDAEAFARSFVVRVGLRQYRRGCICCTVVVPCAYNMMRTRPAARRGFALRGHQCPACSGRFTRGANSPIAVIHDLRRRKLAPPAICMRCCPEGLDVSSFGQLRSAQPQGDPMIQQLAARAACFIAR